MAKAPNLTDIAKLFGITPEDLASPAQVKKHAEYEALEDQRTLEAESVIFYMETKERDAIFKRRVCRLCDRKFLSSYSGVSLCSNECRKDYFESKGMSWDPTAQTEAERWGGTIPRIIGPTATEKLQGMTFPESPTLKEKSSPVEEEMDDIDDLLASLDD